MRSSVNGHLRINPARDARGRPLPGAPLWTSGFDCGGCGAQLVEVHRYGGEVTWEERTGHWAG